MNGIGRAIRFWRVSESSRARPSGKGRSAPVPAAFKLQSMTCTAGWSHITYQAPSREQNGIHVAPTIYQYLFFWLLARSSLITCICSYTKWHWWSTWMWECPAKLCCAFTRASWFMDPSKRTKGKCCFLSSWAFWEHAPLQQIKASKGHENSIGKVW